MSHASILAALDPTGHAGSLSTRRIVLWIRQSTAIQRQRHLGSDQVQRQQMRYLEPLGVTPAMVDIIDARGESGQGGAAKPLFHQLLRDVEGGEVGILVLARHDRLSRSDADSTRMFDALARRRALIMVDGHVYDPSEPNDELVLKMQAAVAQYENKARARWMMLTRLALAQQYAFRIRLPTGLVWASPSDPAYVARLQAAGLGDWLTTAGESRVRCRPPRIEPHDICDPAALSTEPGAPSEP